MSKTGKTENKGGRSRHRKAGVRTRYLSQQLIAGVVLSFALNTVAATFADLAVILAKSSFKGYVRAEASVEECVAFLNRKGICFSRSDLMDTGRAVSKEDVARVFGQAALLYSGEARVDEGCIKKPLEAISWVDYCLLNDIDLAPILKRVEDLTSDGRLREVEIFFKRNEGGQSREDRL